MQQKATVQKLTPNDLKIFMTTNLDLSELHKLKNINNNMRQVEEHTYNNLTVIEHLPCETEPDTVDLETIKTPVLLEFVNEMNETKKDTIETINNGIPAEVEEENEEVIDTNTKDLNTFQPAVIEEEEIVELDENKDTTALKVARCIAASDEVVNRTLAAYVEVCCNVGTPQRGLNAVQFQRMRSQRCSHVRPVKDIRIYNTILKGFAAKADFTKIESVLKIIAEEGIGLDVHSYAAIFECLGRLNIDNNHLKYIRIHVKEAKLQGITFDMIINDVLFTKEQKGFVLETMRAYDPKYTPNYKLQNLQYNNHLLNNLNIHDTELELKSKSTHGKLDNGIFSKIKWKELVEKQIKLECEGFVAVSNFN